MSALAWRDLQNRWKLLSTFVCATLVITIRRSSVEQKTGTLSFQPSCQNAALNRYRTVSPIIVTTSYSTASAISRARNISELGTYGYINLRGIFLDIVAYLMTFMRCRNYLTLNETSSWTVSLCYHTVSSADVASHTTEAGIWTVTGVYWSHVIQDTV
jgi:hypothetical protein